MRERVEGRGVRAGGSGVRFTCDGGDEGEDEGEEGGGNLAASLYRSMGNVETSLHTRLRTLRLDRTF